MDIIFIALAIVGFGSIAWFMNRKNAIENQKANLRSRALSSVSRAVRPNESIRIENQYLRDKDNKKIKIATAKINDYQFDESELTPDIRGYGYEDELPFFRHTDEKGNPTRQERFRSSSKAYETPNILYWQQSKVLDEMATADLVDLATVKSTVKSPEWIEMISLLVGMFKQNSFKRDFKTFNEEAIMFSTDPQSKPSLALLVKDGSIKVAITRGVKTEWEDSTIDEIIGQLNQTANP